MQNHAGQWQAYRIVEAAILPKVTIGIVNHNRRDVLKETLKAIDSIEYPDYEAILVDNGSGDGGLEWSRKAYPGIKIIALGENRGPNAARNLLLIEAKTDYVLLLDNDIALHPQALDRMVRALEHDPGAALAHAEIKDPHNPERELHYNGGWIHYLGAFTLRKHGLDSRPEIEHYDALSGQALLIDKRAAFSIGGFDESYFFGWTDGDFTARLSLAGYRCLQVWGAIAYHHQHPRERPKVFFQVKNRWVFMLKTYSWKTFFLIAPMLLLYELSLAALLALKGYGREYVKGNLAIFKDLPWIMRQRKMVQRNKIKSDKEWLKTGTIFIPETLTRHPALHFLIKIYDGLFSIYWKLVRPLCF